MMIYDKDLMQTKSFLQCLTFDTYIFSCNIPHLQREWEIERDKLMDLHEAEQDAHADTQVSG